MLKVAGAYLCMKVIMVPVPLIQQPCRMAAATRLSVYSSLLTLHGSIPCCAAVSASISVERPLLAVGAPLCELGDDGTEGGSEESGSACVKVDLTVNVK